MEDAVATVPRFLKIPIQMLIGDRIPDGINKCFTLQMTHFFGVYDGHGGSQVANYCCERIHMALAEEIEFVKEGLISESIKDGCQDQWKKAFTNCFLKVDAEVGGKVNDETVGSTAVVALICSSHIVVSNCGDSRAVLCRRKEPIALSVDHKSKEMEYAAANEKLIENGASSSSSDSGPRKGGLRTMPFIIVNECLEKVASYGIMPNMILYLRDDYHMAIAKATNVLYTWSAMSNVLSIFGAFLSDSYLGRFRVVLIGSLSSLLGLTILWLTAMVPELKPSCVSLIQQVCNSATAPQLAVLFLSLGLISIGAGCVRPCSIAFGADQLAIKENSNDGRLLDSYFNWYYASIAASTLLAFSVIVYIQENLGWKIGFGIPAVLMLISAFSFILGSPYYVKVVPSESLLTSFVQVVVVAIKNRKLSLPDRNFNKYYQGHDMELMVPTDSLRCLNKACIIRNPETDLNPDGSISNPWNLCKVGQVESLKSLLRVLPMWSTGIFMMATQSSFSTLQASTMDRTLFGNFKFPAGSFNLIMIITLSIVIPIYDRIVVPLLAKYTGCPRGFSCKVRIGIGLLFVCVAKATSAIVETARRSVAIEEGFEDQPNAIINMSALWLVPEFVLLGIAEAFTPVGLVEFFYSYFPKSMSSFAMALFTLELAAADVVGSVVVNIVDNVTSIGGKESWLSTNINRGHLNYYYALLAFLCMINYLYYLVICWAYGPDPGKKLEASAGKEDEKFDYRELPTS